MPAILAGLGIFDWIVIATTLVPLISACLAKFFGLGVGSANRDNPGEDDASGEHSGSGWLSKLGWIGGIIGTLFFSKGWLARFPRWLKGLFASGGALYFLRSWVLRVIFIFRHPIIIVVGLLISSLFPSVMEYFFLLVGFVTMKVFMLIFNIGKQMFVNDQNPAINEIRNTLVNSFDALPPCMTNMMGYLHLVEDIGIIVTTFTLVVTYKVFIRVYGGFVTGNKYGLG